MSSISRSAFTFMGIGWDGEAWLRVAAELEAVRRRTGSLPTWALENHDVQRAVTRFGGGEAGERRARAALVAMLGFPGCAYVFQGQELGLPEVDVPVAARRDPMAERSGLSRDGVRVPLPWTADPDGAHGFSWAGPAAAPWLPQPESWGEFAVDRQQADDGSMLALFRRTMRVRRSLLLRGALGDDGATEWSLSPEGLLLCVRSSGLLIAVAMGDEPVPLPVGRAILSSAEPDSGMLPPDAAAWIVTG